jgi:hypothetical protein
MHRNPYGIGVSRYAAACTVTGDAPSVACDRFAASDAERGNPRRQCSDRRLRPNEDEA